MPRLARIVIYPVKSLPGVSVSEAALCANGALVHDREYVLCGAGGIINGKRDARIHRLEAHCAIDGGNVLITLGTGAAAQTYALPAQQAELAARLTQFFGEPVRLEHDAAGGFPDDPDAPGPTLVSEASLATVADWFPGLSTDDMRRRFRSNLEIADCPAFWEDRLFGDPGVPVAFRVGEAHLIGTNPCKRCIVPTRDPGNGDALAGFQSTFVQQRRATLPAWAHRAHFDFYYRLATNTRAAANADGSAGKIIRVGDSVETI
jgi:uncharacterized protein YcbX